MTTESRDTEVLNRLLDEAFAPYPVTSEALDLKQEVRANLTARVGELRAAGGTSDTAARQALDELGDVGVLLGETPSVAPASTESWVAEQRRNRVKPSPAFAVRTILVAGALAVVVLLLKLEAFGIFPVDSTLQLAAIPVAAVLVGWIVADALRQETTMNYPMTTPRAVGFGVAAALATVGLGAVWQVVVEPSIAGVLVAGVAVVAAVALFTFLGVTRTNRHKPWAVRLMTGQPEVGDRFTQDPAAAARYGIYTAAIWTVAIAVFIVLTVTIGWAWSWLAMIGGFVAMLVVLARMLFPAAKR